MYMPAQIVPSSDTNNEEMSVASLCANCYDPISECTCGFRVILDLDASYTIYTVLNDGDSVNKVANHSTPASSYSFPNDEVNELIHYSTPDVSDTLNDDILELDGLNCGGIPTRTTPTLTPTTLRTIAADLGILAPAPTEDFAAAAVSDLHHLVSPSCSSINASSGTSIRLNPDLQDHHIQNLNNQHLSLQNVNNQQISLINSQNHQLLNQNSLNQQLREDYNNSFSSASSRQAGFVPPLVLQSNSSNTSAQPSSVTTTVILHNNNSSGSSTAFSTKFSSTSASASASSSHWQGAVVTQKQRRVRTATRRRFTDDEDCDDDYDSVADDGTDSSDTNSGKMTNKQNSKNNKLSSKIKVKSEFKSISSTTNSGRRTNSKDNKILSAEEEQRRQIRRERNKLAAARCRKRRMDHTNELLEETEQLEDKRLRLQVQIQSLQQQKINLQQMLAQHKCAVNMNNGSASNSVSTVNEVCESDTNVLRNNMSTKRNSLQQQTINTIVKIDNDSIHDSNIVIKCEEIDVQTDNDTKDNINIIPPTVMQQPLRRRPNTLLQLNNGNFGNKKVSGNSSTGVVVLNFDSLMDGGTGLTPVSSSSVQNHQQQVQRGGAESSGVTTSTNNALS